MKYATPEKLRLTFFLQKIRNLFLPCSLYGIDISPQKLYKMKTNKYLTALLSLLLLAATAISLVSCNKDDDPKESDINNVNNNDNPDTPSG